MRVRILYFAELRERRGAAEETLVTPAETPAEVYRELAARHGFPQPPAGMSVAVNDEIASWGARLNDGDTVVFLTPFGGG